MYKHDGEVIHGRCSEVLYVNVLVNRHFKMNCCYLADGMKVRVLWPLHVQCWTRCWKLERLVQQPLLCSWHGKFCRGRNYAVRYFFHY